MLKALPFWLAFEQDLQFRAPSLSRTAPALLARAGYAKTTDQAHGRQQPAGDDHPAWHEREECETNAGKHLVCQAGSGHQADLDQVPGGAEDTAQPRGVARYLTFFRMAAPVAVPWQAIFPPFLAVPGCRALQARPGAPAPAPIALRKTPGVPEGLPRLLSRSPGWPAEALVRGDRREC